MPPGPEMPDLFFRGFGMIHADTGYTEHLPHAISAEYPVGLLGHCHIPIQPAQDFFSFGGCVICSHMKIHYEYRNCCNNKIHSRWRESDPQPQLYESCALPLSYIGINCGYHTDHRLICKETSFRPTDLPVKTADPSSARRGGILRSDPRPA